MPFYLVKLIELLSIEKEANQSYLRLKLSTEKNVELLWEIDEYTADNLRLLTEFNGHHKYRLSFHNLWDPTQNQYISYFTKTYRDHSEKIHFPCSDAYVNGLKAIKYNEKISQIKSLVHTPENRVPLEDEVVRPRNYIQKFAWITVLLISIMTAIVGTNSLHFQAEVNENKNTKKEVPLNTKENGTISASEEMEPASSNEGNSSLNVSKFPIVELNQIVNFKIGEDSVALTFDDGPSKYTKEIIDILKNYNVGGTFFFVGNNVLKHPDAVQYVNDNGYSIGNHSMSHPNLVKLTAEQQEYEILHTDHLIEEITHEKVTLFRPPYGSKNDTTIDLMNKTNNKMVLWNSDTEDWKSRNANEIFKYVVNTKSSGSIILLHESQAVIDALPKIIEYLHGQNLSIVSLK